MSKKLSLIVLGSILLLAQGCIFFPAVKGDPSIKEEKAGFGSIKKVD